MARAVGSWIFSNSRSFFARLRRETRNSSASMSRNLRTTWKILLPNRPKRCLSCRSCVSECLANALLGAFQIRIPFCRCSAAAGKTSACTAPGSRTRKISSSASFRSDWRHKAHSPTLLALDKPQNGTQIHNCLSNFHKYTYRINCPQYAPLCKKPKWITSFEKARAVFAPEKSWGPIPLPS